MIRRLAILFSLVTVLAIPSLAHASTVTLNDYIVGNSAFSENATTNAGTGGPFTATTGADGGLLGNNVSFMTFCLEFGDHFQYGVSYTFTLDDKAMNGGVVPAGTGDPVDAATKWLYYQVITGNYTAFSEFGSDNFVGARVQEAIWYLEGERSYPGEISDASKTLADLAGTKTSDWNALAASGFAVWAMNMTTLDGGFVQDQLAMTFVPTDKDVDPVPEPTTLVLLGTGLLATARRFNRRKTQS